MKAVTVKEIKEELTNYTPKELRELCLRLARFKKENKELLTYLLFESSNEAVYIENVKKEVDEQFELINKKTHYLIKKSFRKILRTIGSMPDIHLRKKRKLNCWYIFVQNSKNSPPRFRRIPGLRISIRGK